MMPIRICDQVLVMWGMVPYKLEDVQVGWYHPYIIYVMNDGSYFVDIW